MSCVRLFAMLRERAGRDELELELPDGARVRRRARRASRDLAAGLPLVMAVNREYAGADAAARRRRRAGADPAGLAAARRAHVAMRAEPLSLDARGRARARPARRRGRDLQGRHARGRRGSTTRPTRRWPRERIERDRRRGDRAPRPVRRGRRAPRRAACRCAEPSVVVAVCAPHRGEAFAGAREIIDRIKADGADLEGARRATWVEGSRPATA